MQNIRLSAERIHALNTFKIDHAYLIFIFLVPFIPRPTIDHSLKYLAPASVALVIITFFFKKLSSNRNIQSLQKYKFLIVSCSCYSLFSYILNILAFSEFSEFQYFVSRVLSVFLFLILFLWYLSDGQNFELSLSVFSLGMFFLCLLIIFIGFTGINLFGEMRPPRTYGIKMPFFKNSGVPRSYGELGILFSILFGYLLVYGQQVKKIWKLTLFAVMFLSIIITQSRSTYLAIIIMIMTYIAFRLRLNRKVMVMMVLVSLFLPAIVGAFVYSEQASIIKDIFMSEKLYEKNVDSRFESYTIIFDIIKKEPFRSVAGISHKKYIEYISQIKNIEVGLHNHFLSDIVYLGVFGGVMNFCLLIFPIIYMALHSTFYSKKRIFCLLASVGAIICLQFYEGFFSIAYCYLLALLLSTFIQLLNLKDLYVQSTNKYLSYNYG